jgi:hypothetical protein
MTLNLQAPSKTMFYVPATVRHLSEPLDWVLEQKLDLSRSSLAGVKDVDFALFVQFLQTGELPFLNWEQLITMQYVDAYFDIPQFTELLIENLDGLLTEQPDIAPYYLPRIELLTQRISTLRNAEDELIDEVERLRWRRNQAMIYLKRLQSELDRTTRYDPTGRDMLRGAIKQVRDELNKIETELVMLE